MPAWRSGAVLEVREMGPDDWPEWRSIRLRALTESPEAFTTRLSDWQGPGDREQRWRDRLVSVPFNAVARRGGRAVGMVSATQQGADHSVELLSLWVAPDARGTGVGDLLVSTVLGWARDRAAPSLRLRVIEGNEPAERLYRRHGLHRTEGTAVGSGAPEIAMERSL